jgi:hypothetical protein
MVRGFPVRHTDCCHELRWVVSKKRPAFVAKSLILDFAS